MDRVWIGNQIYWILTERNCEGESVNRSQMDVKCKACDIWTWKKRLFLDTSSANIDTLVRPIAA
jgi:hypothetical protein